MSELTDFLKLNEKNNSSIIYFDGKADFGFKCDEDVLQLASNIIYNRKSDNSQLDELAEILLQSLLYYLVALYDPPERNLCSCLSLVEKGVEELSDGRYLSDLIENFPENHPAKTIYQKIEKLPDNLYMDTLLHLRKKLTDSIIIE